MSDSGRKGMSQERQFKSQADANDSRGAASLSQEQKMHRAMQMAESSPMHREAYALDPVSYLQRLGIDTRGMEPSKLGLQKETLAKLDDDGGERLQVTAEVTITFSPMTFTPTMSMSVDPNPQPGPIQTVQAVTMGPTCP
jgi:hypothetical protein